MVSDDTSGHDSWDFWRDEQGSLKRAVAKLNDVSNAEYELRASGDKYSVVNVETDSNLVRPTADTIAKKAVSAAISAIDEHETADE